MVAAKKVVYSEGLCSIHAEVMAYYKIPPRFRNHKRLKLVVIRSGFRMSKPCERCAEFIKIKKLRVFYSNENGEIVRFRNLG